MPAKQVTRSTRLPIEGESVRLVAVADTHSLPHPRTLEHLARLKPAAILHAGDIGDLAVLEQLAEVAPVHAVRGNIDTRANALPDALTIDVGDRLRIYMTHIAVYGPRLRGEVAKAARGEHAQLVVCGHSHVPFISRERDLAVFNPGSVGPRRFHLPIVFGTIDLTPTGVKLQHVDCETGQPWSPP